MDEVKSQLLKLLTNEEYNIIDEVDIKKIIEYIKKESTSS